MQFECRSPPVEDLDRRALWRAGAPLAVAPAVVFPHGRAHELGGDERGEARRAIFKAPPWFRARSARRDGTLGSPRHPRRST
jgi:hypothetical protein